MQLIVSRGSEPNTRLDFSKVQTMFGDGFPSTWQLRTTSAFLSASITVGRTLNLGPTIETKEHKHYQTHY